MRELSAFELLAVWEQGQGQPLPVCAQTLLSAVDFDSTPNELATMTVARRDSYLLQLREQTFGPRLIGAISCPKCSGHLELAFNVADVLVSSIGPNESTECDSNSGFIQVGKFAIQFRTPTNQDLLAISPITDEEAARQALFESCLIEVHCEGRPFSAPIPADVMATVVQAMEQADTQAITHLGLRCSECGHEWKAVFDVLSFFWREISAWAQRLLREVHVLASSYGWSEQDILAMSAMRRRIYLEMIGG